MEKEALKALLKRSEAKEPIYLQVTTVKNAAKEKNPAPVMLKLPHRIHSTAQLNIALVVKKSQEDVANVLEKEGSATHNMFVRIISINKLKAKLKSKHALNEFRQGVDLLLVDHRIVDQLPNVLGHKFYKSGKDMPVPIRMHKPYDPNDSVVTKKLARTTIDPLFIKHQVKLATKSSPMALTPSTCLSVQIGQSQMELNQLVENLQKLKQELKSRIAKENNSVKAFHIKTPESAALPV